MNLTQLGMAALALFVIAVGGLAAILYVRHWASREERNANRWSSREGIYFKRFLPEPNFAHYTQDHEEAIAQLRRRQRRLRRTLAATLSSIALAGGAIIAVVGGDRWRSPIDLTAEEKSAIPTTRHQWTRAVDEHLPSLPASVGVLQKRRIALILPEAGWQEKGIRYTQSARARWLDFLSEKQLRARVCSWSSLKWCDADVYIVMPGLWDAKKAQEILERGAAMLFYGPPQQVFKKGAFDWFGLRFESRKGGPLPDLALSGDHVLTLGFDAGTVLTAPPAYSDYAAVADDAAAFGLGSDRSVGGTLNARLYARKVANGRVAWMDFSPSVDDYGPINADLLDAVMASVFRYLAGNPYGAWATWPEGRPFAGMISQDTEDRFENTNKVVDLIRREQFPITWFILSDQALRNRGLTENLAEVGEIACHGDNHTDFPKSSAREQHERIARCAKVVKTLTGHAPLAFRPPREEHNAETIDAVANNGMTHFFAQIGVDRMVPVLERDTAGITLVSLPRIGSDDYEMWHTRNLDGDASIELIKDEVQWAERLGAFYAFDFHSQYMDSEHIEVVARVGRLLRERNAYFATAGELTRWWHVRRALMASEAVSEEHLARYRPVYLSVGSDGVLKRNGVSNTAERAALRKKRSHS